MPELIEQANGTTITEYPISITMVFYNIDKRRHDLDNQAASVGDSLVKAGIIQDDNQNCIDCMTLQYGGVDKMRPRCEIFIDD